MAYIEQNDKEKQESGAPNVDYPQQTLGSSGSSADVGSGSGGASTAGIGAGGTGGWTNVQSYLEANRQGTGSAQALQNQVGSQFDSEKKTMGDQSQSFLNDAQKQVDDQRVSNDQADQYINQAAGSYNWQGNQNDDYNANVKKMQGALTNQYGGPTSYSYGFSEPTQTYATGLKDDKAFDSVMNDVYGKSANKALSRGQFDLQKQLDVNNDALVNTRQKLLQDYTGLEGDRDRTVADTDTALGGLADQYRTNQNSLRDYLGQKANTYDSQIAKAEADARKAYQNTYNSGLSGLETVFADALRRGGDIGSFNEQTSNATWKQLQDEQNQRNDYIYRAGLAAPDGVGAGRQSILNTNTNALNNFYNSQDQLYGNTADNEERAYNSILDFLNSGGTRKSQGFKVRG